MGSSGAFPNSFLSGSQKSRKLRNALRQRRTHGTRSFLRNFSAAEFSVCSLGSRPLNAVLVRELTSNLVFLCTKVSHPRVELACPHPLKPLSKLFSHLCSMAPKARKSFPSSSTPKKRKKRNRPQRLLSTLQYVKKPQNREMRSPSSPPYSCAYPRKRVPPPKLAKNSPGSPL